MKVTHNTPSLVHANVADWHYNKAQQHYDVYSHCLDDKGLFHPDFVTTVKSALSGFLRHTLLADTLMRRYASTVSYGQPSTTKPHGLAYQFEQAVAQRGANAKAEFEARRKK